MSSWIRSVRSWHDQPLRFFAGVFLLALIVAGTEQLASGLGAHLFEPTKDERWIWAKGEYGDGEALAFYAARDLEIETLGSARIALAADETYLLYVNGYRVGAGSYRPWAPVDEYDLTDLLHEGINRIVVELRSSRGAGGFLAVMELYPENDDARQTADRGDADRRTADRRTVVSDQNWRIFRRYDAGLLGGWTVLDSGEPAKIWHRPPAGRWRLASPAKRRPSQFQGAITPQFQRPIRFQLMHSAEWLDLTWEQHRIPALGPQQLYDWGEVVEGILAFDLTSDLGQPGLLYVGTEPPDPEQRPPDSTILPVPGRRHWEDAYQRQFRYALLVGVEPYSRVEVEVLPPSLATKLPRVEPNHHGVFGLEPPRSYSKVEEDVWKRMEGRPQAVDEDR